MACSTQYVSYQDSKSPAYTFVILFVAVISNVLCPTTAWSFKTKEALNLCIMHSFKANDSILGDMSS